MTLAHCNAIKTTNLQGSALDRKYMKTGVLGAIGGQHSILPRKPQLSSSRAVDIDMMSSRPWSAVSNEEVIDEQHQLIHKVYMAAKVLKRDVQSASARQKAQIRTPRIKSAPPFRTTISPAVDIADAPPAVDPQPDPHEETKALDARVREQWQWQNHDITGGEFIVGKKKQLKAVVVDTPQSPGGTPTGKSPRALEGGKWLNFGGGAQQSPRPGVIASFTTTHDDNKYFRVDSSTGTHIAMQLSKGNSVRVGINGSEVPSSKLENQNEVEDDGWFTLTQSQPVDVALCWDDLIEKENCKVKIPFVQNSQQTRESTSREYEPINQFGDNTTLRPSSSLLERGHSAEPSYEVRVEARGKKGPTSREVRTAGIVPRLYPKSAPGLANPSPTSAAFPADRDIDPDLLTVDDIVQKTVMSSLAFGKAASAAQHQPPHGDGVAMETGSDNARYLSYRLLPSSGRRAKTASASSRNYADTNHASNNGTSKLGAGLSIPRSASAIQRNRSSSGSASSAALRSLYIQNAENHAPHSNNPQRSVLNSRANFTTASPAVRGYSNSQYERQLFTPAHSSIAEHLQEQQTTESAPPAELAPVLSASGKEYIQIAHALNVRENKPATASAEDGSGGSAAMSASRADKSLLAMRKISSAGRPRRVPPPPAVVSNSRRSSMSDFSDRSHFVQGSLIIPLPLQNKLLHNQQHHGHTANHGVGGGGGASAGSVNHSLMADLHIRAKPFETKVPANSPPSSPQQQQRRHMQLSIPSANED